MKEYNIDHEASLIYDLVPEIPPGKNVYHGEICTHRKKVQTVSFYYANENGTFNKICMDPVMLKSIYEQMIQIEDCTIECEYSNLPF